MGTKTQDLGSTMKKYEIVELNNVLNGVKIGKISKDAAFLLLDVKIELSGHVKKIEEAQRIASEDLKPDELKKEGVEEMEDDMTKSLKKRWQNKFMDFVNKRLEEDAEVNLKKIDRDDIYELAKDNELSMRQIEVLMILAK